MSPQHAFWLGAFAMASARALAFAQMGQVEIATSELRNVLERFAATDLYPVLQEELAPFWNPEGGNE